MIRFAALLAALLFLPATAGAQRLPDTVTPSHYDLAFDVDLAAARFRGEATITVRFAEAATQVLLNAVDLTFDDVTITSGGQVQAAAVTLRPQMALLTVKTPVPAGPAEIHIRYQGVLNSQLRGFYLSQANGRRYAVSQMEATDARRAFPCFDEPAFKATFAITLIVDRGDTAISNGRLLADTPGPGPDRHTVKFSTTARMSSYLVALAVGDFACLEGQADGIPLRICATKDKVHLGRFAMDAAQFILAFYNRYYEIRYPFEKLDILAVPDFSAGAMENTGAIFYRETNLLADEARASIATRKNIATVLAHELAHQWFGNLVTMAWWNDLWLNEGFATWMANRPVEAWKPEWNVDVDEALQTQTALELDALASTRPIRAPVETPGDIDGSFDAIAYEKGSAVLRMVEGFLGREPFRKGINAYLAKFAYGNATSEDFWRTLAASSGQPVDAILEAFVTQPGAPLVRLDYRCTAGAEGIRRALSQRRVGGDTRPGRWTIPICLKDPAGQRGVTPAVECAVLPPVLSLPLAPRGSAGQQCTAPWAFANAGATGYYRSEYDTATLAALTPEIQRVLTAPERLSLVGDVWALVRSGRQSVGDFLTLASGFAQERSSAVLGQVAGRLSTIRTYLTTPETRPRLERHVRRIFGPLASELGPNTIPGEPTDRTLLRAHVTSLVGEAGGDPATVAYARTAVADALAGRRPLESTSAAAYVNLAASHGDRALFDAYVAQIARSVSPEERYRYLYALAQFPDPDLVDRALALALTPEFRTQDVATFLNRFLSNPATNAAAWRFVKAHWSELSQRALNFLGDTRIANGLGSFCDAATRDDIVAFFRERRLPSARRALEQSIERINACIALRDAQMEPLSAWLAAQP
ncbi:MAG: M1 family metallopeptidase [Vicinamibacterales bacterium]